MIEQQTFVLVHGAWHGAWVWDRVRAALAALGHDSVTVDLPSCGLDAGAHGTLFDDAAAIEAAVDAVPGPTVVVAHSYAGMPASQAALPARSSLIFIAAFVPEPGMSLVAHSTDVPPWADIRPDEGVVLIESTLARDTLYHDLSDADAAQAVDRLVPQGLAAPSAPVTRASWQNHRSAYVVCSADRSVPVKVQRMFAARTDNTREIASSHSPMLSRPDELAALLVATG